MTDLKVLVQRVLNSIHRYRDDSGFVAFEPIDDTLDLGRAVNELTEAYSPAGILPDDGARLWRELVQASKIPEQDDYLRVFDDLDAFERWLIDYYQVPSSDRRQSRREQAEERCLDESSNLKEGAPENIFEAVTDVPAESPEIAVRAGHGATHTRRILSDLVVLGRIEKVKGGYVRRK